MKLKAILAKTLAIAVAVTTILPGNPLSAKAAPTVFTETTRQWMYTNENNKFVMEEKNWLNAMSEQAFQNFGRTLYVGEGLQTWRLTSSATDGNDNKISYAETDAPACVYAKNIDISSQPDSRRVMRFVLYPPANSVKKNGIRLGIMLKYVDATHWTFLGFNGNWYMQWMNGLNDKGWVQYDSASGNYLDTAGQSHNRWEPAFNNVKPADETYVRLTVVYEDSTHIRIRVAKCTGTVDEDGNAALEEQTEANSAAEDVVDFKVFGDLRKYADEHQLPIHLGFVAGTDRGQLNPEPNGNIMGITKMDIVNVMKGALKPAEAGENNSIEDYTADDYKEPLTLLDYSECGWTSPKEGANPEDILAPSKTGDGYTYATLGKKAEHAGNTDFEASIYNKLVTDFDRGTVSGVLRPYTVGNDKECSIGILGNYDGNHQDAKSFKIGIKDGKWSYNWNGTDTEITGSNLPPIANKQDYKISMTIDENHKLTADVTYTPAAASSEAPAAEGDSEADADPEEKTVELISKANSVDVTGLSGSVSLSTKGEILRARHIVCKKIGYDKTPLEFKVDELKNMNADHIYYEDSWTAFAFSEQGALYEAQKLLNNNDSQFSTDDEGYAPFNETAAQNLQNAFNAFDTDANKVAAGKASLTTEYNKIKEEDFTAKKYTDYYTTASIQLLTGARDAVAALLRSLDSEDFAGITKAAIDAAKSSIAKDDVLVPIEMTADQAQTALNGALDKVKAFDDPNGSKYYNNWSAFADALQAVKDLLEADSFTKLDVETAIQALEDAAGSLTEKTLSSLEDFQNEIAEYVIPAEDIDKYYEKKADAPSNALEVYKDALAKANEITTDSTVKAADKAKEDLIAAFNNIQPKPVDKAAATAQINAIVNAVSAKKYKNDANWTEYQRLLKAAQDLVASANPSMKDLEAALAALKAAQSKLVEDTTPVFTPPAGPQKGEVKTVGNATYTIEDPAAATVILKTGDKKTTKNVKVDKVVIDSKTYTVVGIAANAFKNGKMKSVTIGANVVSIGKNAFANCKRMTSVTIGKKVKKIEAGAFSKCTKLKTVTFKGTVTTIAKKSFKGSKVKTVKVPKSLRKNKKFLQKVKKAGMNVKKLK